jgi:CheY-like chemotaxis protein
LADDDSPSREGKKILLVDDEPDILESLSGFLEASVDGLKVLTASSGPKALAVLKDHQVDLIITDYKMPEMNGLEFLMEAQKLAPDTPRMILTAFPKLELAIQAINEVEVEKFLTKPIDPPVLLDMVNKILTREGSLRREPLFESERSGGGTRQAPKS